MPDRNDDHVVINMDGEDTTRYRKAGPVAEIGRGMGSIFWGIRNPIRTGLRGFGLFCSVMGLITVGAGVVYMAQGNGGPARLSSHPVDLGRWGAKNLVSPLFQPLLGPQPSTSDNVITNSPSKPVESLEDLYRRDSED
ncbi:MAG: hypothetical protein WBA10_09640 [Elainellaceae cyanobacterium]